LRAAAAGQGSREGMTYRDGAVERPVQDCSMCRETAERFSDDSIASVACELRGPLRSVLKLAQLLKEYDGAIDADTREYADYIRANAEHMSVMLAGLMRPRGAGPSVQRSSR